MSEDRNKPLIPASVINEAIAKLCFNADGLVSAIAQQYDTAEVLMLAWMNADAVRETLTTGRVCYWSRSRARLWRKGESSGQTQTLKAFRIDCDGDCLLLLVDQVGVACHTGRRNCFFTEVTEKGLICTQNIEKNPADLYGTAL